MISRSAGYHVFSFPEMSAPAMWCRPVYFQRSAIFLVFYGEMPANFKGYSWKSCIDNFSIA